MYKIITSLALALVAALGLTAAAQAQTAKQVRVVYHLTTGIDTVSDGAQVRAVRGVDPFTGKGLGK